MDGDDLSHALRRFAGMADLVRGLAARSETFRDMCEELAAAERALDALAMDEVERRDECQGWIERLSREMSEALQRAR